MVRKPRVFYLSTVLRYLSSYYIPSCSRRLDFALTALRAEFDSYCVPG